MYICVNIYIYPVCLCCVFLSIKPSKLTIPTSRRIDLPIVLTEENDFKKNVGKMSDG